MKEFFKNILDKIEKGECSNKTIIIYGIALLILSISFSEIRFSSIKNENTNALVSNQTIEAGNETTKIVSVKGDKFDDNFNWHINERFIKEDSNNNKTPTGFFCVKESRAYNSFEVWDKNGILFNKAYKIKYELKTLKNKNIEPIFYISFGKGLEERVYWLVIPDDKGFKTIGLENYNHKSTEKEFYTQKDLECEVNMNEDVENEIVIDLVFVRSNKINIGYEIKYYPIFKNGKCENESIPVEEKGYFEVDTKWSLDVDDETGIYIGFGVKNGVCFRINHFEEVKR